MLRRVFHFFAGILIAGMTMTSAAGAAEFEITPFAGYTGGGDFNNTQTGGSLSFDDTSSYGIVLDFKQAEDSWIELYFSRQQTRLRADQGLFVGTPLFDVDVEYYHLGGTYGAASGMVRPFACPWSLSSGDICGVMKLAGFRLAFVIALLTGGCVRYDQPPKTMMIEQAYFTCSSCGSLRGGVFGKGPTKRFQVAAASHCVHDWQRISYEEFKALATQRFGVDWSKEIPYWSGQAR